MDLLVEKGDSRTYLSRYKVITTSFEESSPSVKRNNTQIQYRNGNVDFGGWHEAKKIDYVGYYRADDIDEEETLREKIYALLSDPDGYYITQLKNDSDNSYERPGENTGDYFEKQVNRPSHKRFYVYASSLESELVGSYGGHVLYKISATFTTMKLPYGESVPRDLDVKPNVPYYGRNLLTGTAKFDFSFNDNLGTRTMQKYDDETNYLQYTSNTPINAMGTYWYQFTPEVGQAYTLSADVCGNGYINGFQFNYVGGDAGNLGRVALTNDWHRISNTFHVNTDNNSAWVIYSANSTLLKVKHIKIEKGNQATDWSPASEDPEYNAWYLNTYYKTDNLIIPYAGTVACSQLEQGFTIEFTAKECGSNFKLNVNGNELTYNGQVYNGDVLKLSGYEYTKNDISIVKSTNKAYFKLIPGVANTISSNLHGAIKILGYQDLYA